MPRKAEHVAVHLTPEQDALIHRAAEAEGTEPTTFVVRAAVTHAHSVLADCRRFVLDSPAWTEFGALLDRPIRHKPALAKLFAIGVD